MVSALLKVLIQAGKHDPKRLVDAQEQNENERF